MPRPTVVALCGSSRFKSHHEAAMREETLAGRIVIPMGLYGHVEGLDMGGPVKARLDELHLAKIDLADEVLVVNPRVNICAGCRKPCDVTEWCNSACCAEQTDERPYVGDSTRREIAYAEAKGKRVRYLDSPEGSP